MGVTKSNLFSERQNGLATLLKALAHPARIAILQYLAQSKTCICGDLVEELGLAHPTIAPHLKELNSAGFIQGSVDGSSICYCINTETWDQCRLMLDELFIAVELKEKCC
jgi:DNA-binding transcriptional ArsR family regulator